MKSSSTHVNRPNLNHFDDEAARVRLHSDVIRKWHAAGAILYDFGDLPETVDDACEVSFSELRIEDDAFLVRFGEGARLYLDEKRGLFIDGVFVLTEKHEGKDGAFIVLVAAQSGHGNDISEGTSRIACGWIDADRSVDDGLTYFGLIGDPSISESESLFDIDMVLGQAIARVGAAAASKPGPSSCFNA